MAKYSFACSREAEKFSSEIEKFLERDFNKMLDIYENEVCRWVVLWVMIIFVASNHAISNFTISTDTFKVLNFIATLSWYLEFNW